MLFQSWAITALTAASLLLDGAAALKGGRRKFAERSMRKQEKAQKEVERHQEAQRQALEARQANYSQQYRFYDSKTARMFTYRLPGWHEQVH